MTTTATATAMTKSTAATTMRNGDGEWPLALCCERTLV